MSKILFTVCERVFQEYHQEFDEKEYNEFVNFLKSRAEDDNASCQVWARDCYAVFKDLTFEDICAIYQDEALDRDIPHDTWTSSVIDEINDWVRETIWDNTPEYVDSEEVDNSIEVISDEKNS